MNQARFIPLVVHGILSYALGAALVLLSLFTDVAENSSALASMVGGGIALLALTLVSDTPVAAVRLVPAPVIEGLDYAFAMSLVAFPFVFDLADERPLLLTCVLAGLAFFASTLVTAWRRKLAPSAAGTPGAGSGVTAEGATDSAGPVDSGRGDILEPAPGEDGLVAGAGSPPEDPLAAGSGSMPPALPADEQGSEGTERE